MEKNRTNRQLEAEVEALQIRLEEAEETLRAIQNNEVDALVIEGPQGQQVFTLQGAEQPYRTLMETMSEGALTVAVDGTILYCNERFAEMLEEPLNRIMGVSLQEIMPPEDWRASKALLNACGEGCRGECHLRAASGREMPVLLSIRRLPLDGQDAFCLVVTDLTEQKQTQEALEKARDRLEEKVAERTAKLSQTNAMLRKEIAEREEAERALRETELRIATTLASIGDAVIATDPTGSVTFMNAVAESLTGWTLHDALQKPITDVFNIVNEGTHRRAQDPVAKVLKEGVITGLANHTILIRKDGTEVPIDDSAAPIGDGDGETMGVVLVFRDVTERRRAQVALQESEVKYRNLFENSMDAIFYIDPQDRGRILDANEQARRMFGFAEDEIIQADQGTIFDTTDPRFVDMLKKGESGKPFRGELTNRRKDGSLFSGEVSSGSFMDGTGQPRTVVTVRDITDRKRTEEALKAASAELEKRVEERTEDLRIAYDRLVQETREREELERQVRQSQKMEALGTLAGGIAHDFNNILAAVIGFSEMIQERVPPGSTAHRYAARVLEAGMRGRELVKHMLTFSRQAEPKKKPIRVSSVIKESVKLLRASIPTTIGIHLHIRSESGVIIADPVHIQQVLMNLCTNAYYAMREKGGVLEIELSDFSVSSGGLNPYGIEPGLYLKLTVRDTGGGIPADVKDRIFDPFFTTKGVGEGTGLGLSVVMGIVKQSGGHITVESEPSKGSTFSVYFPKAGGEGGAVAADGKGALPTGSERILFIDDEEALIEMGGEILTGLGYHVTSRTNGSEALDLFSLDPTRFDLVITDQTMPEMTGVELAKKILALKPDMPVILCTGFSHMVGAESAQAAGIKAFAMKPLTKREIAGTIRKVLDEK